MLLEGRVYHRLLNLSKHDSGNGRKKQKIAIDSEGPATNGDNKNPNDEDDDDSQQSRTAEAGFYFVVVHHETRNETTEEYLLSVPQQLIKKVCDAARFGYVVQVSKYRVISLANNNDNDNPHPEQYRKRILVESNKAAPPNLLEVHNGGLVTVVGRSSNDKDGPPNKEECDDDSCIFMTLPQILDFEKLGPKPNEITSQERNRNGHKRPRKKRRQPSPRYNLTATVDSISPIIVMGDGEPFALMELYDNQRCCSSPTIAEEESRPCSCVVVFQGTASLLCHEGIVPGDDIRLRQTKRQRWKIPEEVLHRNALHLRHRVPTHVFVVKDARDIGWQCPNDNNNEEPLLPPSVPIPSTPVPLVSLQGRVVSREWASRGRTSAEASTPNSYIIHAIELQSIQQESSRPEEERLVSTARQILFLTYYPMAPALTLSLRPGAIIQAVNVHCIGRATHSNGKLQGKNSGCCGVTTYYYGACLRSTLSILGMAPSPLDDYHNSSNSNNCSRKDPARESLYKYYPSRPYALLPIQRSYREYACRKELYEWFHVTCDFPKYAAASDDYPIPTFDEVAKLWWECYNHNNNTQPQKPSSSSRNPYIEFFNHACDGDDGDNENLEDASHHKDDDLVNGGQSTGNIMLESSRGLPTTGVDRQQECHASISDSSSIKKNQTDLPHWVSLSELRQKSVVFFKRRLKRALQVETRSSSAQPPVGWTASICLSRSELLEVIWAQVSKSAVETTVNDPHIYSGGFLAPQSADSSDTSIDLGLKSASLADGQCILPATVAPGVHESKDKCHETVSAASFAFGRLNNVIVSCICVGAAPGLEGSLTQPATTSDDDDHAEQTSSTESGSSVNNPYKKKTRTRQDFVTMLRYKDEKENTARQQNSLHGACSLLRAQGHLFLVSIQLRFDTIVPCLPTTAAKFTRLTGESQATAKTSNADDESSSGLRQPISMTVQQCLDPEAALPLNNTRADLQNGCILGCLARKRFRLAKIADNRYRGFVITLSHIPISQANGKRECTQGDLSCVQSIEVKTVINYKRTTEKRDQLKLWMKKLLPEKATIGDDLTTIALAWWNIADDARWCALTAGGLDDTCTTEAASENLCVTVQIPFAATLNEASRGYKRFLCPMEQLRATFIPLSVPKNNESAAKPHALLDSIGGFKFLPGMLDRHPPRKLHRADAANNVPAQLYPCLPGVTTGELMALPTTPQSGIPQCSLGDLLRSLCLDLQNQQNTPTKNANLAPSLVRDIIGANFLGVSFCQAQAVCRKCFQSLRQGKVKKSQDAITKKQSGRSKGKSNNNSKYYWHEREQQPSFWHCPLPIPGTSSEGTSSARVTSNTARFQKALGSDAKGTLQGALARESSDLCCPNGCPVEAYGEIKWECSGLLDDGKAQAKLYAERETATLLLGMCQSTIDMIEAGVWKSKAGSIVFSKTAPPPPHLAKAVEGANFKYMAQKRFNRKQHKQKQRKATTTHLQEKSVLHFLEPVDRATYLIYQHCRHSSEVTRPLDYLVRCKPLADNVIHLNHTEFEVVSPGPREGIPFANNVATYSLPPLKLNLVDCCSAAPSGTSVVEETWDLIQAMHNEDAE